MTSRRVGATVAIELDMLGDQVVQVLLAEDDEVIQTLVLSD